MKKILIILVFASTIFGCEAIWNNGPTALLKEIFRVTQTEGIDTLETAVEKSSKWTRPKKLELWHVYSILDRSQRIALTKIIKHSDLAKEKLPKKQHYDVVIVLGAATSRVKVRIAFLIHLYEKGITWDKIYLLGSTRDLKIGNGADQQMAEVLKSKNIATTEMAMVEYLWQQTKMPESLKNIPIQSMQVGERPDGTRADTEETLTGMVKNAGDIKDKNFLFISNNPYICLHDSVAKRVLEKSGANVETVGEAMRSEPVENVLDTIVKCLTNMQRAVIIT